MSQVLKTYNLDIISDTAPMWFPYNFPNTCCSGLQTSTQKVKMEQEKLTLLSFPRFLSVCVVTGLRLLHVSHSSVDRHLLQAPSQPHPAPLRMGASHHRHGHQQVCVCVCLWTCVCECLVLKGEGKAHLRLWLPVSGLLDDSSPKQIAAHTPPVPLSLAALQIQPAGRGWLSCSLPHTHSL